MDDPTSFASTTIKHLFATPLVISELPAEIIAELNPKLKEIVLERFQHHDTVHVSNYGGWQSDDKIAEWGGEPVAVILTCLRKLLNQITIYLEDSAFHRAEIDWKINGWANINQKGNFNTPHVHPGAYWSAVYYVAIDDGEGELKGGAIEFMDPRGSLPNMYCPVLRMGIQGYMTAGRNEIHKPKAGQCIIFPSWLFHSVAPYTGDDKRISLAFNFSV